MPVFSQKPALDTSVFRDWPKASAGVISPDGKYITYEILHSAYNAVAWKETVLQSTSGEWKRVFNTVTSAVNFSSDGKTIFFILSNDSLAFVHVGEDRITYQTGVEFYKLTDNYLVYKLKGLGGLVKVISLSDNSTQSSAGVLSFELYEHLDALLLSRRNGNGKVRLTWYSLKKGRPIEIWEGIDVHDFMFNESSANIAFVADKCLWVYHVGDNKARLMVDKTTAGIDSSLEISSLRSFSTDGSLLFFTALPGNVANAPHEQATKASVTVWSYSDQILQSQVQAQGLRNSEYAYAVNVQTRSIRLITGINEQISSISSANDYVVIQQFAGAGSYEEQDWNPFSRVQAVLKSLKDTIKFTLPVQNAGFSKNGKYLLYFDQDDYYAYELKTKKTINLTANLPRGEFTAEYSYDNQWLSGDKSIILYAQRDIWEIDPTGRKAPVNITNGYGAKHNIIFYPVEFGFKAGKEIVLSAFNVDTKDNGFYKVKWGEAKDPEEIIMEKVVYYSPHAPMTNGFDNKPLRAAKSGDWLVRIMSEKEAPNYFVTKDFSSYKQVTSVYPEKKYNWVLTALHQWKDWDGNNIKGVLYKPADFDSTKKYPVIFYYYELFSDNLHAYLDPGPSRGPINIPWFVSHGYLVFVPDIHYQPGKTGYSAFNAVASAARHLSKEPYVDTTRLGLQGHSFGGYETNYIITQTNLFKAACSASGISDLISMSGNIGTLGQSLHYMVNRGQFRMHAKLWEAPQRFMENSPIFYVERINTPLLLMHTRNDKAVSFNQALELFNGMRMFRKKVWFLIYDDENHALRKDENKLDYTWRMDQFFDYYLKNANEPTWMKNHLQ
jgi:dienelactone hydrolase